MTEFDNNSISTTIDEDELELIREAMEEITDLTPEGAEHYNIDSGTILAAKNTLEKLSTHNGYGRVSMSAEEVNDMTYALTKAFRLEMEKYNEEITEHTEPLRAQQKELTDNLKTKEDYPDALKDSDNKKINKMLIFSLMGLMLFIACFGILLSMH